MPEDSKAPLVLGGLAVVGVGTGLYLWLRKPPGISPGEKVKARFTFKYLGSSGNYVLLVRFGYHRLANWFDPEEGLDRYTKNVTLDKPDSYKFDVDCIIPDGAPARIYDAEGSILSPSMQPGKDWITRYFTDKAITVRK